MWFRRFATVSLACCALAGCGLVVPNIAEIGERDIPENAIDGKSPKMTATAQIEYKIINRIKCDLEMAVQEANRHFVSEGPSQQGPFKVKYPSLFPPNWAAQVALSLEVDELSALSPGVSLNQVLPNAVRIFGPGPGTTGYVSTPQLFSIGFGGTASSTATRIDKFNPYWSIDELSKKQCTGDDPFKGLGTASSSPLIIESELGIQDWLVGSMSIEELIPSTPQPKGSSGGQGGGQKPESISIEIKFVIVTSGNVTPTWKLVHVSANTSGTFFNTMRTRTHDLIITIGPNTTQTNNSHLASQVGNAVSAGNRALLAPGM